MEKKSIPFLLKIILAFTRHLPPLKGISGISNRIIKPIWCKWHKEAYILTIWDDVKMLVNPCDCIGGNLTFIPQLYDRWERSVISNILPKDGIFVDLGSNIGAYALWAASCLGKDGKVLAYEADKENYNNLVENICLNNYEKLIQAYNVGVSDCRETLYLHRNIKGNKGGHSFIGSSGDDSILVECMPLLDLIKQADIIQIDILKLDIEGFETKVLTRYFQDVPSSSTLRPNYLLLEINEGPINDLEKNSLLELVTSNGYEIVQEFDNTLFRKVNI